MINDVTLTGSGAWFTDSTKAMLYFVEVSKRGELGASRTVNLTGPAAELSGQFNLNGIAAANGGRTLIVSHSANGALYTVDPKTGASAAIAGISVPSVDGIVLSGRRLWAVQNSNQITRILLNDDLTAGTVEKVITSDSSRCRARRHGSATGWRSSTRSSDTGIPPTADQYECWSTDSFGRPIRGQRRLEERGRPQAGRDERLHLHERASKPSTATAASPRRLPAVAV